MKPSIEVLIATNPHLKSIFQMLEDKGCDTEQHYENCWQLGLLIKPIEFYPREQERLDRLQCMFEARIRLHSIHHTQLCVPTESEWIGLNHIIVEGTEEYKNFKIQPLTGHGSSDCTNQKIKPLTGHGSSDCTNQKINHPMENKDD